jgi:hypothetical protein
MTIDWTRLTAPFAPDEIEWRVGSTNADKTKGMALAYMDARAVMRRLDDVCGPENWQCRYPHANTKTICEIGIYCGTEWVWKADGAGDTDFEAEKGAMSDAFKRAAFRWGIGRYLYDLDSPWVAVEQRGRSTFIKKEEMPKLHKLLGNAPGTQKSIMSGPHKTAQALTAAASALVALLHDDSETPDEMMLDAHLKDHRETINQIMTDAPGWWHGRPGSDQTGIEERIQRRRDELRQRDPVAIMGAA